MTLAGSSLPCVQVEEFEGPLDLLLDEVRRQNVAIEKISIAPIAARFLDYMRTAGERNLNLDIEWVHMAATLIYWKSRFLLPAGPEAQSRPDPIRDEIVQQLLAHRHQAAEELARRRSLEDTRFSRETDGQFREKEEIEGSEEHPFVSVWDLLQRARELARWASEQRDDRRQCNQTFGIEQEEDTVSQMIEYLQSQLAAAAGLNIDGICLLAKQQTASRRSCLFLGMLEMARDHQVEIEQYESFGPIMLLKTKTPALQTRALTGGPCSQLLKVGL
jgi:segregation and condensation protein A